MPGSEPNTERRQTETRQRALREIRRAEQQAESGQVAEAIQSLEQALRFGADRYTCYLRIARLYQTRRQWAEAVSAAEKAIEENPGKLTAREAVIALYLESRDYTHAVEASRALLKLAPRHVPARDALGAAYMGLGDLDAAMRVANDLIRLDPANPSHRFTKAHLCQHRGEVRMAVEEFERVVTLAPESDIANNAREQLDSLDAFQLNQIVALAREDSIFRAKLAADAESATAERGFFLSEEGHDILRDLVGDGLTDADPPCRPSMYH